MNNSELTYWVTLALIPRMWTKRKNALYVECYKREPRVGIEELMETPSMWDTLDMTLEEKQLMDEARQQLASNSFMVENLLAQGYNIIPLTSPQYPTMLKKNLGTGAPCVLYTKGNEQLLNEPSVAIVGSRNAQDVSLTFTGNVARKAVSRGQVVVSGFAKGVDRMALDATVDAGGKSIIVLPQGITTFAAGFKQYYKPIIEGRVIVVSTFAPQAPWTVEFAMARNSIIYGLASEIYVAQTDDKGGTWAGATDGLRKGRPVYVRYPEAEENCSNVLLMQRGGIPVDLQGERREVSPEELMSPEEREEQAVKAEIEKILGKNDATLSELRKLLTIEMGETRLRRILDEMTDKVERLHKGNKYPYHLKSRKEPQLFD